MKKTMLPINTARGFTLVELMVALLLGLIISIGVVQIFSATRATYQLDESLARAQENGRFALEFLTRDIRHAGYLGCRRDTTASNTPGGTPKPIFNNLAAAVSQDFIPTGISGAEFIGTGFNGTYLLNATPANTTSGWAPAPTAVTGIPSGVSALSATGALAGSDILALQRMVPNSWALIPPYISPLNVHLDPLFANRVQTGDIMMVSDCNDAVVFIVTGIDTTTGLISRTAGPTTNRCASWAGGGLNTANDPTAKCGDFFSNQTVPATDTFSTTAIGRLETVVFFVANDITAGAANPRPTLFRRVIGLTGANQTTALVEGVENFQVLYGIDNGIPKDGVPDLYVPASAVTNFADVVSLQIGLLIYGVNASGTANDMEIENAARDTQIVAGTNIVPPGANDRRKRRVFNTTIQLRNRSF